MTLLLALLLAAPVAAAKPAGLSKADVRKKESAARSVDAHGPALVSLADQVWAFAETALRETRSAALLADYAEKQGFRVERGIAGMPTAFVASYGTGRPVIAILGEYDALPGLSQKAVPERAPLVEGAAGHGCGHNLFGAASLGAAIAVKELIAAGRLQGTVRFYGTPAEESVGGKVYMARDGLFKDVDVALAWHPADRTRADTQGSQAIVDFVVEFKGTAAHAAADPWNGRSAVDAVELFTHALNLMREHVRPTVRMHYTIVASGDVPNVVPERGSVWIWVRDFDRKVLDGVLERVRKVAEGAALAAGVEVEDARPGRRLRDAGQRDRRAAARRQPALARTDRVHAEEEAFARKLQAAAGVEVHGMETPIGRSRARSRKAARPTSPT